MKTQLPETKCHWESRFPFCTVHMFTHEGTKFYSGRLKEIEEKVENQPTCHGVVMFHKKGFPPRKRLALFGRHTLYYGLDDSRPYLKLCHINARGNFYTDLQEVKEMLKKTKQIESRPIYFLVLKYHGSNVVIGSWRRMPSCYLRELALFEQNLPQHLVAARLLES